jgi:phospholipid transport system transporter-binding protein
VSEANLERTADGRFVLSGVVSFETVPELARKADSLFDHNGPLVVDLREVTHSDSAGVALLVEWVAEATRHHQEIRYLNIPSQMLAIARVSSLDHILPLSRDSL